MACDKKYGWKKSGSWKTSVKKKKARKRRLG